MVNECLTDANRRVHFSVEQRGFSVFLKTTGRIVRRRRCFEGRHQEWVWVKGRKRRPSIASLHCAGSLFRTFEVPIFVVATRLVATCSAVTEC
jgi:hypothetical protein